MATHIKTVNLSIAGAEFTDLVVSSCELTVAVNAIPAIALNALPIRRPKGQVVTASGEKNATGESLYDQIMSLYKELLSAAKSSLDSPITATITLSVEVLSNEGAPDTITLQDWVFTDVGLSPLSTVSAPMLTLVFTHPIIELNRSGYIYETPKTDLRSRYAGLSAENMLDMLDAVYELHSKPDIYSDLATKLEGGIADSYREIIRTRREHLSKYRPSTRLTSNIKESLFLSHVIGLPQEQLSTAIAETLAPHPFGGSTWERLISEICPEFALQIIPTYDQPQLSLEAFAPWQSVSSIIEANNVETFSAAPMDPMPIVGTVLHKDFLELDPAVDGAYRAMGTKTKTLVGAAYFPPGVKASDPGAILELSEPAILNKLRTQDKAEAATVDGDLQTKGNAIHPLVTSEALAKYAEAAFLANYRKNCKGTITAIMGFYDSKGQLIHPGRVIAIKNTDSSGKSSTMIAGYLTRMIIRASAGGAATSTYELMHVRPSNPDSLLVTDGTPNPCYSQSTE